MAEEQTEQEGKKGFASFYNKNYELFLIIPAILLILSLGYLFYFYNQHQDIIIKDVSLMGGTTITVYQEIDLESLEQALTQELEDFSVRGISDLRTRRQIAFVVQTTADIEKTREVLETYLEYELTDENSSTEFTGSSLSSAFYSQLRIAIIVAFILMAIVVFIIFRTFIPSLAVVLSAFADITMTLALVDFLGWKVSSAGIVAFLMLIGYSVDTDIMLTTRILRRREESIDARMYSAFKTGITMTLTSLVAVVVALIITAGFSEILKQIFSILAIGLSFDLLNTWVTNAGILKWYAERKEK
jgi:preprotein translocase subunit SecF